MNDKVMVRIDGEVIAAEAGRWNVLADSGSRQPVPVDLAEISRGPMVLTVNADGKTGTADKQRGRGYARNARIASFVGAFPMEVRGMLASLGIVKGQPFQPDGRMRRILTEAVAIGNAYARANTVYPRDPGHRVYKGADSEWVMAFADKDTFFLKPSRKFSR